MRVVHICLVVILFYLVFLSGCDSEVIPIDISPSPIPVPTVIDCPFQLGLNGDEVITVELGCKYEEAGAYCLYGEIDLSSYINTTNNIDTSKLGQYTVNYAVTYRGERHIARRRVNVTDSIPPEIILVGDRDLSLYTIYAYKEPGFIAFDNYDGDLTEKVDIKVEKVSELESRITYTVKDSSGNEKKEERHILYKEPEITDIIYLTFDDGPHKDNTPKVLDILKEYDVNATFFLLDFDDSLIPLVDRMKDEGHAIAIHGYSHYYKEIYASEEVYLSNLKLMQNRIREVTGLITNITRFPFGSYNTISEFNPGIMERLRERVPKEGYVYFDWNVSTGDGVSTTTAENMVKYFINGLKRGRNNIILMHDSWGHENTVEALPVIIKYGLENGYLFGVITERTPPLY